MWLLILFHLVAWAVFIYCFQDSIKAGTAWILYHVAKYYAPRYPTAQAYVLAYDIRRVLSKHESVLQSNQASIDPYAQKQIKLLCDHIDNLCIGLNRTQLIQAEMSWKKICSSLDSWYNWYQSITQLGKKYCTEVNYPEELNEKACEWIQQRILRQSGKIEIYHAYTAAMLHYLTRLRQEFHCLGSNVMNTVYQ